MGLLTSGVLRGASVPTVLGVAAGSLAVGGVIGALTSHPDGTRTVRTGRHSHRDVAPKSKDEARASLENQRSSASLLKILGGTVAVVGGVARLGGLSGGAYAAVAGALLLGAGFGKSMRLDSAPDAIDNGTLPEHTATYTGFAHLSHGKLALGGLPRPLSHDESARIN